MQIALIYLQEGGGAFNAEVKGKCMVEWVVGCDQDGGGSEVMLLQGKWGRRSVQGWLFDFS